jgi:hypothetical protein
LVTAPSVSSAPRNRPTTCRFASTPSTA